MRFAQSLLLPANIQKNAQGLMAWHLSMSQLVKRITEPMILAIRYAWWRETLAEFYGQGTIRNHELMPDLTTAIAEQSIPQDSLQSMIDSYQNNDAVAEETLHTLLLRMIEADVTPQQLEHVKTIGAHYWQLRHLAMGQINQPADIIADLPLFFRAGALRNRRDYQAIKQGKSLRSPIHLAKISLYWWWLNFRQ